MYNKSLTDVRCCIDAQQMLCIHSPAVLFPLMGIEIGMEIIYFHSEK